MNAKRIKDLVEKVKSNRYLNDRKVIIYLVCVVIASVFWFLRALSDEYTTTVSYPVKFKNLPENKVLTNELPKHLDIRVNAHGFTLLRYKLSFSFSPLVFNVNAFTRNQMEKSEATRFTIATARYKNFIQSKVSSEMKVMSIEPDSIKFVFDRIVEKKLPVKAHVNIDFEKQFLQSAAIQIAPDSVVVSGPQSILDTVDMLNLPELSFTGINKTIRRNVHIEEIDQLRLNTPRVVLTVPVEQYTESFFEIPLTAINVPDSLGMQTFPSKVKVTYQVALSNFAKIRKQDFQLAVDYNDLDSNKTVKKLPIKLTKTPEQILNLDYEPQEIEYLIGRK